MAKVQIPGPLERRDLIEGELAPARALALADAYIEAGRSGEAVAFLAKADAVERLEELCEQAIESGDAFLLQSIAGATGVEPGTDAWRRLAEAADAAGKEQYANLARRQSHVDET